MDPDEPRLRPINPITGHKVSLSAIEVISPYLDLQRVGRRWRGLCPFHSEKTPSFYVHEEKGFYCFGCQEHGDVIDFIRKIEGVSFKEALSRLGIDGGDYKPTPIDTRKRHTTGLLASWMNEQHLKFGAMLRDLSRCIAIAEEAGTKTLLERFEREFSILEILFADLVRPECAADFLELKDSIEAITARAPAEPLPEFPEWTPEFRAYLQELVA